MEISPKGTWNPKERTKKMRTTSVGYGQHPRRTAALVALVVVSLTATTTGTGLVLAGPASAQSPTAAGTPVATDTARAWWSLPVAARHEGLSAAAPMVRRTAGLGSARAAGYISARRLVDGAGPLAPSQPDWSSRRPSQSAPPLRHGGALARPGREEMPAVKH